MNIPKIEKGDIPKIIRVYIPSMKKIYISNPSTSFNQQISYIPKPSLSIIQNSSIVSMKPKLTSVVSTSPIYNYIQKGIPVKSYASVQALSTYPLKAYSTPKILKYNQNVISQIPNMKAIVPIQPAVQIPSTKYSNRIYITPGYALPSIYSGPSYNSSKSRNNLNFVGNKYVSKTYQARKL